jgi:hypothetical protein
VASSADEHPVEALTLERADEPIGDCVGLGALIGMRTIRSPSERKISSKAAAYFVSRSRIRNRNGGHSSHRTMRLRACWVTGPLTSLWECRQVSRSTSQQGALAAGFGRWAAAAGCQKVARFAASRGLWGRFRDEHRSDRTSQEDPGHATTVFGTVVRLGDTDKAGMAKVRVKGPFRGGRGTRTHKSFRTTVFKCVVSRPDPSLLFLPKPVSPGQVASALLAHPAFSWLCRFRTLTIR